MSAAEQAFREAFPEGREPRSPEYRAGVLAALRFRFDGVPLVQPYPAASAAADAWFAGVEEGHRRWRDSIAQPDA